MTGIVFFHISIYNPSIFRWIPYISWPATSFYSSVIGNVQSSARLVYLSRAGPHVEGVHARGHCHWSKVARRIRAQASWVLGSQIIFKILDSSRLAIRQSCRCRRRLKSWSLCTTSSRSQTLGEYRVPLAGPVAASQIYLLFLSTANLDSLIKIELSNFRSNRLKWQILSSTCPSCRIRSKGTQLAIKMSSMHSSCGTRPPSSWLNFTQIMTTNSWLS